MKPDEVVVADSSGSGQIAAVTDSDRWSGLGLHVRRVEVTPPNAVLQRKAAIQSARGDLLLLLDDDVVLEMDCLQNLTLLLQSRSDVVGVVADFNNQPWAMPTIAWRIYLRYGLRLKEDQWQGRVVGPLLRFGFNPTPASPLPMDWIGAGNSLVRRSAFETVGGFSDFFLHRCTVNEDVDLGLKLRSIGKILFCPSARLAHHQASGGRLPTAEVAEDDLYNRFWIMRNTMGNGAIISFGQVGVFFLIETLSNLLGALRRLRFEGFMPRCIGRLRALTRIVLVSPL